MHVYVTTASHALQLIRNSRLQRFLVLKGNEYIEVTKEKLFKWAVPRAKWGIKHPKNKLKSRALIAVLSE